MPSPDNPIRAYLRKLRAQKRHDEQAYAQPPPPPQEPDRRGQFRLRWNGKPLDPLEEPQPLHVVREGIGEQILSYVDSPTKNLLLIRVPPGTGKTTAAVLACQQLVRSRTQRILYAAPRHDFFQDIRLVFQFNPSLWYEWLPYTHKDDKGHYDMCEYAEEMIAWIRRGYPGMHLCLQLCRKYIKDCPYRLQAKRKEPIILYVYRKTLKMI